MAIPNSVVEKIVNKYNSVFNANIDSSAVTFTAASDDELTATIGTNDITVNCLQSFTNYGTVVSDFNLTGTNSTTSNLEYQVTAVLGRDSMINTNGTFDNLVKDTIISTQGAIPTPTTIAVNKETSAKVDAASPPPAPAPAPTP